MDKYKVKYKATNTFLKEESYKYLVECEESEATAFDEKFANYIKDYIEREESTEIELIKI